MAIVASAATWSNFAAAQDGYVVTNDEFEPRITVKSPEIPISTPGLESASLLLRSWVDKKTHAVTHQLYLSATYVDNGWRFFDEAFDNHANAHAVTYISRRVENCGEGVWRNACRYTEIIGIDIGDEDLKNFANSGVEFKIKSKSGFAFIVSFKNNMFINQIIHINPYIIDKYVVDQTKVPPKPIGADLYDEGVFNRKFYSHLDQGLHVGVVAPGSPLDLAGVKRYDWLWELNGVPLKRNADLDVAMRGVHGGSVVPAKVKRGDQFIDCTITF